MNTVYHITSPQTISPQESILLLEAGQGYCNFGIMNYPGRQLLETAYYTSAEDNILASVFTRHSLLAERFYQVLINYTYPFSVLVPEKLYNYNHAEQLLKSVHGSALRLTCINESLPDWQLHNVYGVPPAGHEFLIRKFPGINYWHHYSLILKNKPAESNVLMTHFRTNEFSVVALKENRLLLAQTFSYSQPEDVLYQLLKICTACSISQQTVSLVLSGLVEENSVMYRELYKYFLHTHFYEMPVQMHLGDAFGGYPSHYFSSLFNLAACAL